METKLISMVDFILDIDWLTTTAFCEKYNAPLPMPADGVMGLLTIDAIKHRMFLDYAKFLNRKLTIDMFEGEKRIFTTGQYNDLQPSTSWNYYSIGGKRIFQDNNTGVNNELGLKIGDLVKLDITYIKR
ncbi:gp58-like family protein [Dyadobacter sp. CY312]|uniref:gp58-like family protein n=1 Tax=Dyadobacter sp. CY312 TaxID=2907303 RepID=UPI001F213D42|nr:gp58-like family protein [Dyadobacter sp. CY312]MCE7039170.1 gp58-like family protein [Dyadobacter sp. CY312]